MMDSAPNSLRNLLRRSGLSVRRELRALEGTGQILLDGSPTDLDVRVKENSVVSLLGHPYRVVSGGGRGRLQAISLQTRHATKIPGLVRVHAGYHKCLTEYCKKIYRMSCTPLLGLHGSFKHFHHRLDAFYAECDKHPINSVSGHAINLDMFDDIRVIRFVRDPRDMLVSGYFYHKRAAEPWCDLVDPTNADWMVVNGNVPNALPADSSLAGYLNAATLEEGLMAELDFRHNHYLSMLEWPVTDHRVRLYRYEDILGNEVATFSEIFNFLGISGLPRWLGLYAADRRRASRMAGRMRHIRNPDSGQWRKHFTERVSSAFNERYGSILDRYGYARR